MNKLVAFFVSLFCGLILTMGLIFGVDHIFKHYNASLMIFAVLGLGYFSGVILYSFLTKKYKF